MPLWINGPSGAGTTRTAHGLRRESVAAAEHIAASAGRRHIGSS